MKLLVSFLCAAGLTLSSMAAPPPFKVTSLAREFADFRDATQGMSSAGARGLSRHCEQMRCRLAAPCRHLPGDVHALAALDCNDAHRLVVETVQALRPASLTLTS